MFPCVSSSSSSLVPRFFTFSSLPRSLCVSSLLPSPPTSSSPLTFVSSSPPVYSLLAPLTLFSRFFSQPFLPLCFSPYFIFIISVLYHAFHFFPLLFPSFLFPLFIIPLLPPCLCHSSVVFIIYINDLDTWIASDVRKFAVDTKIGRVVQSDQDASVLQDELDRLCDWAGRWQVEFNVGMCSILSVGRNNPSRNYSLNGTPLSRSGCERDLSVMVSADLRLRTQCIQARIRANRVVGFISRSVSNKFAEVIHKL